MLRIVGAGFVEFKFADQLLGLQLSDLFGRSHRCVHIRSETLQRVRHQHDLHTLVFSELQCGNQAFCGLGVILGVFVGGVPIPCDGVRRVVSILAVGFGGVGHRRYHQRGFVGGIRIVAGTVDVVHHIILHALALFVEARRRFDGDVGTFDVVVFQR